MTTPPTCPLDERLTALLLGDLPANQAAELRAHLAGCEACRTAAAEIDATLNLVRGALAAQAAREPAPALATNRRELVRLAAAQPPPRPTTHGRFLQLILGGTDREKQARRQLLVWASAASFVAAVFLAGLSLSGTREKASCQSSDTVVTMEELKIKELSPAVIQFLEKKAKMDNKPSEAFGYAGRGLGTANAEQPESPASQATDADSSGMAAAAPEPEVQKELADNVAAATVSRDEGLNMDVKVRSTPLRISGLYASRGRKSAQAPAGAIREKNLRDKKAIGNETLAEAVTAGRPAPATEAVMPAERSSEIDAFSAVPAQAGGGAMAMDDDVRHTTTAPAATGASGPGGESMSREVAAKPARASLDQIVRTGGDRLAYPRKKLGAQVKKAEQLAETGMTPGAMADADLAPAAAPASPPPMAMPEPPPIVIPAPPPATIRPFVTTRDEAFSTFAIDVDTASYALARADLRAGRLPVPEAVRVEEFVNAFDYDYTPPAGGQAFAIAAEFAPSPFRSSLSLLKLGVKGAQLGRANRQALVLTVILDASGSMNSPDRLGLARQALKKLLGRLRDDDRIALVQFSAEPRLLLEATPAARRQTILAALDGIQAAGSTHLENGLRTGYAVAARAFRPGAANRVLLLSDGVANLGAADADSLLKAVAEYRRQGICLSVYGVGSGAYNDALLEQLADKGDGTYTFFDSIQEARRVLVDQFDASMFTIAKDVKIQVEFNPVRVTGWRQIGYDNRQLTKEQFRDDSVDAGEIGAGQAVTALYELALAGRGDEALGTVRVRYRDPASGAVREIQQTLTRREGYARFTAAPPRFRLAAGVAEFAELLRGSPFVDGSSLREVDAVLQPVALELKLDGSVQELVRLLRLAERMRK